MEIEVLRQKHDDMIDFFEDVIEYKLLYELTKEEDKDFLDFYVEEDTLLDIYEKYCIDNDYSESEFHSIYDISTFAGEEVSKFLEKNELIPPKYDYFRIGINGKYYFYTEEEALEEAKNELIGHMEVVCEWYEDHF